MSCENCGTSITVDSEFYEKFHVSVCFSCKDTNDDYTILTKTQARTEFLLTDEELADSESLPSISRPNPHNPRWADMKLYLKKQIREFSIKKYGSENELKTALVTRHEVRSDKKSKQFLKKLKELRSKTKVEKKISLSVNKGHVHSYLNGKCVLCGLKVVQEEI